MQVAPTAIDAPESAIELPPAVAVTVPLVQVVAAPAGVETFRPVGSVSENATPVTVAPFAAGLPSVNVTVELAFGATVLGENPSEIVGGPMMV
jgi:hypothetical protein